MSPYNVVGLPWKQAEALLEEAQVSYKLSYTRPPRMPLTEQNRDNFYVIRQTMDKEGYCNLVCALTMPVRESSNCITVTP